jgi:tight adherence protein B
MGMPTLTNITLALLVAGVVFFLAQAFFSAVQRREAGKIAVVNAVIAEQRRLAEKPTIDQRILFAAAKRGYTGTMGPLALGAAVLFLVLVIASRFLSLPAPIALLVSVGGVVGGAFGVGSWAAGKRKAAFDRQLLELLSMLAGQLESGVSIETGLERVAAASEEPLSSEMRAALQQGSANRDLVGAMRRLSYRYPSRAFDLFVAALEIDRDIGSPIEPSLREAASMLSRDFALNEETRAETGQVRAEFYGILVVMGIMLVITINNADRTGDGNVYFTGFGAVIFALALAWIGFGILRALRLLNNPTNVKGNKLGRRRPEGEQL